MFCHSMGTTSIGLNHVILRLVIYCCNCCRQASLPHRELLGVTRVENVSYSLTSKRAHVCIPYTRRQITCTWADMQRNMARACHSMLCAWHFTATITWLYKYGNEPEWLMVLLWSKCQISIWKGTRLADEICVARKPEPA